MTKQSRKGRSDNCGGRFENNRDGCSEQVKNNDNGRDTEIEIMAMARYLDNGSAKDDFLKQYNCLIIELPWQWGAGS